MTEPNLDEQLDEILSQLMKDAITNRRADDPPQGRKMLLNEAKQAIYKDLIELIDSCGESDLVIDGFVLEKKLEEYFK